MTIGTIKKLHFHKVEGLTENNWEDFDSLPALCTSALLSNCLAIDLHLEKLALNRDSLVRRLHFLAECADERWFWYKAEFSMRWRRTKSRGNINRFDAIAGTGKHLCDNDPQHFSRSSTEKENLSECPSYSSDLNLKEMLWDELKSAFPIRRPINVSELNGSVKWDDCAEWCTGLIQNYWKFLV